MPEWTGVVLFLLGCLWAIPAWYLGKAAGMKESRRSKTGWMSVEDYKKWRGWDDTTK